MQLNKDIIKYCEKLKFGKISLNKEEIKLNNYLNDAIFYLCKSLPESVQTEASLFLVQYLNIKPGQPMKICNDMYYPVWSLIYHLAASKLSQKILTENEYIIAIRAQAIAFFLHHFDDNLNDNDIKSSHLNLIIRSQAYVIMINSINELKNMLNKSENIEKKYFNDYYYAITNQTNSHNFEEYCGNFTNEIATLYIVPNIIAKIVSIDDIYTKDIINLFSAYGIAVRLLDDINDIDKDLLNGTKSSIYYLLSPDLQNKWQSVSKSDDNEYNIIFQYIESHNIINIIVDKINYQLEAAANFAKNLGMDYLAQQFEKYKKSIKRYNA